MLKDIVAAHALDNYRLYLRFENEVEGVVDLARHLKFHGVFEALQDPAFFAQVRVDPELGTVLWPNGADLDPDVLYARLTGTPVLA
jgi:hypothetical protein